MNSEQDAPDDRSWSTEAHDPRISESTSAIERMVTAGGLLPPDHPGQQALLPPYEIVRMIDEGGMGVVLLGRHMENSQWVAIKLLKPGVPHQVKLRLPREANLQSKLDHRHIVKVLEADTRATFPYFVMPFFENGPLSRRTANGPLSSDLILSVSTQISEALRYASERGVLHRDIKPSNILLDEEDNAYLADFGLQLRFDRHDSLIDPSRPQRVGTYPYMAPEVASGKVGDARSDIYSFGASLYEMLAGRPPYDGDSAEQILNSIRAGAPPKIEQINPLADSRLTRVASAAMAYDFRDRYDSWQDLCEDLRRISVGQLPLGPHSKSTSKPWYPPARAWKVAALVVLVVLGTAVGFGLWRTWGQPVHDRALLDEVDRISRSMDPIGSLDRATLEALLHEAQQLKQRSTTSKVARQRIKPIIEALDDRLKILDTTAS